jgi:phage terminase small subunit
MAGTFARLLPYINRCMTPNKIKAEKGTETYNAKTGTTIKRDSGKRPIKESVESHTKAKAPAIIKSKRQKELWNRLIWADTSGVFTALDEGMMAMYVVQMVEFEKITEELENPDLDDEGKDRKRRLLNSISSSVQSIGSNLGFDPISRAKIAAPSGGKPKLNKALWGM